MFARITRESSTGTLHVVLDAARRCPKKQVGKEAVARACS